MKPFSLSVLLLLAALAAPADVVMVNGTIYDVGKGAKSVSSGVNINIDNRQGDSALCWAATASNLIQHWQDKYLPAGSTAPNGLNGTNYTTPTGTRYLALFDTFIENFNNNGGSYGVATEWYFGGKDISGGLLKTGANPGNFVNRKDVSSWQYTFDKSATINTNYQFNTMAGLKSALNNAFTKEGVGVYLSLHNSSYGSGGHAISCWGYETDDSGKIVALIVSDSDDKQFGARRLTVVQKADGQIYLESSNPLGTYNQSEGTYVLHSVSYITDPLATARSVSANTSLSSVIASSSAVSEAVEAKGTVNVYKSISLEQGSILAASGKSNNNKLSITGNGGTALDGKLGSFINLRDTALTIRNTSGDGLHMAAEAYLDNGSVDISSVGGTGVTVDLTYSDNAVYLEMDGNDFVKINNNKTGGLVVKSVWENYMVKQARADISHNKSVEISGNVAAWKSGAGAQINGILTMTDNDSVTFSGNRSTYNYEAGGGALEIKNSNGKGNVTIANTHGVVLFENNEGNGYGGAVKASGILTIKDNEEVKFTGNKTTHNNYGGGALAVTGGSGSGEVTITGNDKVVFNGNYAKASGSAIVATGNKLTLSGNGVVEFTSNTGGNGSVIRNDANSVVEIAHNTSLKFSGNEGTADISNNGTFYVSADAGKTYTFEHGIKNADKGVTYLGKDSAGTVSTGGTYVFAKGEGSVTMQNLGTTVATIGNNGGMQFDEGVLTVINTEFSNTNLKFTQAAASLTLSDVTFTDAAVMTVDLGYFGEGNYVELERVTGRDVSLTMLIDLVDKNATQKTAALDTTPLNTGLEMQFFSASQNATLMLDNYFGSKDSNLAQFNIELILNGQFEDDTPLIIDAGSTGITQEQITAAGYKYERTEDGLLYYATQELVPEPATATLSLLALAALCARRRRKR